MAAALMSALAACSGGSHPASRGTQLPIAPPDLKAFLELPVATPSDCPPGQPAATIGRVSPWTGHVDISVFLQVDASAASAQSLGHTLRSKPLVQRVYFESAKQAHAEFARLYTCSSRVPASQTPASYRVVLNAGTTTSARNAIVTEILRDPVVDSVSCDPSNPCVDVVRSARPSAGATTG